MRLAILRSVALIAAGSWLLIDVLIGGEVTKSSVHQAFEKSIKERLQMLPGFWSGEAIETPVGPMNYDMAFHSCSDGIIAGVAKTGASLHYWQFQQGLGDYRLRFLSTFGGNRKPVILLPGGYDGTTVKFYAPDLKLLTLTIRFSEEVADIRIFHHGKLHVHIKLNRENDMPAVLAAHHTLVNSCRGYPVE